MEDLNLYDFAIQLIGTVPVQFEFIYIIATFVLFICFICVLLSPLLLFKAIGKRR